MSYLRGDADEVQDMLGQIGVNRFEELLKAFPRDLLLGEPLRLPEPLTEDLLAREFNRLAGKRNIVSRSEFSTCYTPYQPEVSQGTLQAIFEYQSLICALTGMDVANASVYDGASAAAEAVLMAQSTNRRPRVLLLGSVHPWYREVISTYCSGLESAIEVVEDSNGVVEPERVAAALDDQVSCVVLQQPNFYGFLEAVEEISSVVHRNGALLIAIVDPMSLALIKPPGEYDCDIAVGEGQVLGSSLGFGGPLLGIFAAKKEHVRKMPGRLVGVTEDVKGQRGYVLTLQTREQHIRREKATSNICTNQGLVALAACVYMTLNGADGLQDIATRCYEASHEAAAKACELEGFSLLSNREFFKEFTLRCPVSPTDIIEQGKRKQILAGIDIKRFDVPHDDCLLVAVTERRTGREIAAWAGLLKEAQLV
jgi:glycine dehydrogenase subunit 1